MRHTVKPVMMFINKCILLGITRQIDNEVWDLANINLRIIKFITTPDKDELFKGRGYDHYTY